MQDDATAPAPAIRAGHLTATDAMAAATGAARAADHLGCIPVLAPDPGLAHAASLCRAAPDAPLRQAPVAGAPTLAKDLGDPFPGLPVAAGSRLLAAGDGGTPGSKGSDLADRVDILLTPMAAAPPRPSGWPPSDHCDPDRRFAAMSGFGPLASLADAPGFPTITLPVQMIAPRGARALLIAAAGWLEAEGRWSYPLLVAGLAA